MNTKQILSTVAVIGLSAITMTAHAQTPLSPGGTTVVLAPVVPITNATSVVAGPLASSGSLFLTADHVNGGTFAGTVTSEVVNRGANNTLGGLTFLFQIKNTSIAPKNGIAPTTIELDTQDYTDLFTSVFQQNTTAFPVSGFAAPGTTGSVQNAGRTGAGDVVKWNFSGLKTGDNSYLLAIDTNAHYFTYDNVTLDISGRTKPQQSLQLMGYSPAATPEASTIVPFAFMGLGLLGLMAARRKKAHATLA